MTLTEARELVNLSQAELDRRAGLANGTVGDLESGRNLNPSHTNVTLIVRALQRAGLKGLGAEDIFPVPDREEVQKTAVAS